MCDKNKSSSLDVLGIKPIADSVNTVTKGSVDGASAFLSRICLPAAEEFGLLLRDKVSSWRSNNAVAIANKAQTLLQEQDQGLVVSAHPRIIFSTLEYGSWAEDDLMQNLWAGLLASSCTPDGKDESNIIFINILSQLTSSQAKIISHICQNSDTFMGEGGLIFSDEFHMEAVDLLEISGINDIHQLDRELDHLRSLELINQGFNEKNLRAEVSPHALCLQLYARSQGYVGSPTEFYGSVKKAPDKNTSSF